MGSQFGHAQHLHRRQGGIEAEARAGRGPRRARRVPSSPEARVAGGVECVARRLDQNRKRRAATAPSRGPACQSAQRAAGRLQHLPGAHQALAVAGTQPRRHVGIAAASCACSAGAPTARQSARVASRTAAGISGIGARPSVSARRLKPGAAHDDRNAPCGPGLGAGIDRQRFATARPNRLRLGGIAPNRRCGTRASSSALGRLVRIAQRRHRPAWSRR